MYIKKEQWLARFFPTPPNAVAAETYPVPYRIKQSGIISAADSTEKFQIKIPTFSNFVGMRPSNELWDYILRSVRSYYYFKFVLRSSRLGMNPLGVGARSGLRPTKTEHM
jgi:hypothetical protein